MTDFRFPRFATLAAVLLAAAVSACSTIRELPRDPADAELSAEAAEDYEISRKLLEALLKNDSSGFVALLRPELQEEFRKDKNAFSKFRKILEDQGEPVSFSYVTTLESAVLTPYIWKIRLHRTNKQDQEFHMEVLFRVVVGRLDPEEPGNTENQASPNMGNKPAAGKSAPLVFGFNLL